MPTLPITSPETHAHEGTGARAQDLYALPRASGFDHTVAFLRDGYGFIGDRARSMGTDVFRTRLLLKRVVCMVGEEAARIFYGGDRFTREGAMPPTTLHLLQDQGSVQLLDGEAHHHRKAMFLSLLGPHAVAKLTDAVVDEFRTALPAWERAGHIVLHDEAQRLLARAACAWCGIPSSGAAADERAVELGAMIEGAGSPGWKAARGLLLRRRSERWARALIEDARAGLAKGSSDTPLHVIARHRDTDGRLLTTEAAAVELLNLLRPTVAVARFLTFAALALHRSPSARARIRHGDEAFLAAFVLEVRRFYPFFPVIGGRVRRPFEWRGVGYPVGTWVLLDLYGTDHDPRSWDDPERFRPERFLEREVSPFELVPQGGGTHLRDHRCPGEWATEDILAGVVRLLVQEVDYTVPPQDLTVGLSRMPALPASGMRLENLRAPDGSVHDRDVDPVFQGCPV